jgi:hypothetical protein
MKTEKNTMKRKLIWCKALAPIAAIKAEVVENQWGQFF